MTLLYLALGYFAGILAGYLLWQAGVLGCDLPPWLWLLPLAGLPFTIGWERRVPDPVDQPMRWPASAGFVPPTSALSAALVVTLGLAFTSGLLRYASQPLAPCPAPSQLAFYNATSPAAADPVTLIGYVNGYPQVQGDRQYLVVRAQAVHSNADSYAVDGLVRVKTTPSPRPVYGQPVRITGILQLPPVFEDFDYREYLAGQGVHSVMDWPRVEMLPGPRQGHPLLRGIYRVRSQGETLLKRLMPEPHAALANGMLLGIESGIPNDLYAAFNRTGASHTIVISGSNVALLSGVILAAGVRLLGRRRALWPTLAGIVFYALLVGGDASVTRAALMGGLFVTATTIGRQSTALVSLGAACWTMTLLNPLALWDVGFQLSAAATAGLILFSPVFTSTLDRLWPGLGQGGYVTGNLAATGQNLVRGLVTDGLLMTLAATLTSMPLLLFHFNRISLVSLVTNQLQKLH